MCQGVRVSLVWCCLFTIAVSSTIAADESKKPALLPADYGQWETLGFGHALSADGAWLAYPVRRENGENALRVCLTRGDTEHRFPYGSQAEFAATNRYLIWKIGISEEERERLEEERKPLRTGYGLLTLADGTTRELEEVREGAFDETGRYVVFLGYAPEEPKGKGADLTLIDLESGTETTFGNVAEYAWSDAGSLLALVIATGADRGNGIQVYDAVSGALKGLDSSGSAYHGLSWREKAADLAVYRSSEPAGEDSSAHDILAWRGLDGQPVHRLQLGPDPDGAPEDHHIVRHRAIEWSKDGRMLSFGLAEKEPEEERDTDDAKAAKSDAEEAEEEDEDDLPRMQIWHTADIRLIPEQKVNLDRDSKATRLAVWQLNDDRVVTLAEDPLETITLTADWLHAIELDRTPYPWGRKFGRPFSDLWLIDPANGNRQKLLEKVRFHWISTAGHYVLSFDGDDYWTVDLRDMKRVNITRALEATFADTGYDTPTDRLPPHGVAGWLAGDEAVLLYDRFDVWRVAPDGSGGTRLTRGREDEVIHRVVDLDPETDHLTEPIYLETRGEWTEKQGFSRLKKGSRRVEALISEDKYLRRLTKAEDANVFVYSSEARDDAPDFFATGPDFEKPHQITGLNPFQDDYAWTRAELFSYDSEAGVPLQAALLYPVNHEPGRRYPMIVYTYEQQSQYVHIYEWPSERDYYNMVTWTQQGYFVLMPDIVYRAREPGPSALESVRPAVAKTVEMGLVDAARVGLIGHSWGGYQATYLPTRTDIFAASVAGAPLTDFVSFMGQIHWNPGIAEVDHWETGQARMEVPYWEDPEAHHRSSPLHEIHEMETPMLMAHGNKDGVVEFFQATLFYNYARRAGKQMVLLVYEDEDHGFSEKANQIDYHRRILEWFGHYLKGEPAPAWITEGIALEDIEEEKRRVADKSANKD